MARLSDVAGGTTSSGRGTQSGSASAGGRTDSRGTTAFDQSSFISLFRQTLPAAWRNKVGLRASYKGLDGAGRPVYAVTYTDPTTKTSRTRTLAVSGPGRLTQPSYQHLDFQRGPRDRQSQSMDLTALKGHWLMQTELSNMAEPQKADLRAIIEGYNGNPITLSTIVEQFLIRHHRNAPDGSDDDGGFTKDFGGDGGGGFGGGFAGPTYRAPDRRVVEDYVKGTMVSLLGAVDPSLVDPLVKLYMQDDRRNFDSASAEIDPAMSVVEALRQTEDYQQIHALRPESEDERQWVGQRRQAAAQGGLQLDRQEEFGRIQAAVGGDLADVREAGAVKQTAESGTTRGTILEQKVKQAATTLFQGVR